MSTLVIVEHDNKHCLPSTLNTVTAAQKIDASVDLLVAGLHCKEVANAVAKIENVGKVWLVEHAVYQYALAEDMAPLIVDFAEHYSHILAPATTFGKDIMPRVAALLDVDQISDITSIESADTFKRPIYAGNAIATVKSTGDKKVITVRSTGFDAAKLGESSAEIVVKENVHDTKLSAFVEKTAEESERPDLTAAQIVISGGRGVGSQENFELLYKLADKLGAAVGASRAAVDAGYVPNDMQVGQTGKVVAPSLYIAVGISGAIQHLAGMKESGTIVAINKDPDAPIFQVADYGLEADLFEVLPELTEKLS